MSTALKKERKLERPPRGGLATMVEAIRAGIWEEMERDPTVFLIGEDVGTYGGAFKVTEGIIDEFGPERMIECVSASAPEGAPAIISRLIDELRSFVGAQPQNDDITLIAIRKT